jgi:hypothetical protein
MRLSLRSLVTAAVFSLALVAGSLAVTAEEAAAPTEVALSPLFETVNQSTITPGPGWFDTCTTASLEDYCQCHCKLCANPLLGGGPENCRICQSATCNFG